MPYRVARPRRCLIRMAGSAWIGNFVFVGHRGGDKSKSMNVNLRISRALRFNRGHVASDALTSRAPLLVVRVFLDSRCPWTVRR